MKKSKNFDDVPVLGGVIYVSSNIILNFMAILIFLDRLIKLDIQSFFNQPKYSLGKIISASLIVILPMIYYSWKGRYKKIIKYYDNKKMIPNWLIIILSMTISFILLLLAGMFRNRDWIFG